MQVEESTNHIAHSQSLYTRFRTENMALNKSEPSVSSFVVLIHTRSEDSSDSDSVASVNQAL